MFKMTRLLVAGLLIATGAAAQPPASVPPSSPATPAAATSAAAMPTDWIYVIDTSLTMLGRGKAEGKNIFADVKKVIYGSLDRHVRVGDTVRLISFDRAATVGEQVFIGSDGAKDTVRQRVEALEAQGRHTHIALALRRTTEAVSGQTARDGRGIVVLMFTDGIEEPPDDAEPIDLQAALDGLMRADANFHFVNLGTTAEANDLLRALNALKALGRKSGVYHHPGGEHLSEVINRSMAPPRPVRVQPPPPPPLVLTVRALDAAPIVSGAAIAWTPFEVNTNRPVQAIRVDAQAPPGVRVETIAPILAGQTRPRVTIAVPEQFDGQQVAVRFVLRPAEEHAAAVEVTSRLSVAAPSLFARIPAIVWLIVAASICGVAVVFGRRWWLSPTLEGTLLAQRGANSDAINLRSAKASRVLVGRGGRFLTETPGFQLEIAANGTRARIDRVTATLREGTGTLNRTPLRVGEARTMRHNDELELESVAPGMGGAPGGRVRVTYQNFKFQTPARG